MTLLLTGNQMNTGTMLKQGLRITIPFFWAGMVLAISFLEAPLKFQAPGITLQLGLGIGQLVFTALNRIEWVLAIGLVGSVIPDTKPTPLFSRQFVLYGLLIGLLLWQTVGLLPMLSHRIDLYQHHRTPEPSLAHWYYVLAEVTKLILLLWVGFRGVSTLIASTQLPLTKTLMNPTLTETEL